MQPAAPSARAALAIAAPILPVINFPEQVVVLPNEVVIRIERDRFFVRLPRQIELALLLVRDAEVVPCGGVGGIELDGAFPAERGLVPEAFHGDLPAKLNLRFGV